MPKAERVQNKELSGAGSDELLKLLKWLQDSETSIPETAWRNTAPEDYKFYAGRQDDPEVEMELAKQNRDKAEALDAKGFTRFATAMREFAEQYNRQAEREEKRISFEE